MKKYATDILGRCVKASPPGPPYLRPYRVQAGAAREDPNMHPPGPFLVGVGGFEPPTSAL
jgi:hypothetical protein